MLLRTLAFGKLFLCFALLGAACSKTPAEEPPPFEETPDGGFGSSSSGTLGKDGAATSLPECAEETKDVFVISEERSLYRFNPPTLAFKNLGIINCPTGGAQPTSMAVDRHGIAWVRYTDGAIWKVSTKDLSCEATAFVPPNTSDGSFQKFGMGFATSSKGGSAEELFISDNGGAGLAKIDTTTLQVKIVGPYTGDLQGKTSELTGTGDGTLFGFFVSAPAVVAQISKGTGEITNPQPLANTYAGSAWAFSFYGGAFRPALADVRTARFLTDGVEVELAEGLLQMRVFCTTGRADLQPGRLRRETGRRNGHGVDVASFGPRFNAAASQRGAGPPGRQQQASQSSNGESRE